MTPPPIIGKIRPFTGVIGIDPNGRVTSGYDSEEPELANSLPSYVDEMEPADVAQWVESQAPAEDRIALADYMLHLWGEYKREAERQRTE
jgi:hypothetical protein